MAVILLPLARTTPPRPSSLPGKNTAAKRDLKLVWAKDMRPRLLSGGTLVKGLLDEGALSVIYAPSNAGKSFFCLDLCFHIALGWDWRSRKIRKRGCVVYIAAEGGHGFTNRVAALKLHHGLNEDADIPLAVLPTMVDLLDPAADTPRIVEMVREVEQETGLPVVLVVVDTLSRAMAGGDENGPKDMTGFVANIDRIRAVAPHCMIIHHTGKDVAKGARGHSSLRAATDTEIELLPTGNGKECTATITKQRDMEGGDIFLFTLLSIQIGVDDDGDPVASAVVEHIDDKGGSKLPQITASETKALLFLADLVAAEGIPIKGNLAPPGLCGVPTERWRAECDVRQLSSADKADSRDKAFRRAAESLQLKQRVSYHEGLAYIIPQPIAQ